MRCMRIFFLGVMLFTTSSGWAGSPGIYQKQALNLVETIQNALITHGYCHDRNDCVKKKLSFFDRTSTGIGIEIYEISDTQIIQEVIASCVATYADNNQEIDVTLSMYRQSHEEMMGFAKLHKKPFVSMHMKGERQ